MPRARRKAELELELFHELSKYVKANARRHWPKEGASIEDIKNDAFVIAVAGTRVVLPAEGKNRDLFFRRLMWRAEARHGRRHRRSQKAENQLAQDGQQSTEQDLSRAHLRSIAQRAAIKLAAKHPDHRQTLVLLVSGKVDKKDNQHLASYLNCKVRRAAKIKAAVMQALMDSATEFNAKGEGEI